jgi:hypothetical protein
MTGNHLRNTGPLLASLRCGAKTRSGKACRSPAVQGKSAVGCMAVRRDQAHREAIRTRSRTAFIGKPRLKSGGRLGRSYSNRGNCCKTSSDAMRKQLAHDVACAPNPIQF